MDFKKAQLGLNDIVPAVITLVVAGVVTGAGALVLSKFNGQLTSGSTESLAVLNATEGIKQLSLFYPTIGIVIAAVVIIGLIITAFRFRQ